MAGIIGILVYADRGVGAFRDEQVDHILVLLDDGTENAVDRGFSPLYITQFIEGEEVFTLWCHESLGPIS